MTDRNGMTLRCISLILVLLLVQLPCLWADTLNESYTEPTSFRLRWSVTNAENSSWVVQEYDETNPIIVSNTIVLDTETIDPTTVYQHVCKVTFTSNKSGYHDFYCKALPFKVQSDENGSNTTAGYTLRFSFGEEPDVTRYYYEVASNIVESHPAYYLLPLSVDCLSSPNGVASQTFYVDILLSDWDSMGVGTNVAQLSFVKETI